MPGSSPNLVAGLPLSRHLSVANDGYNYEDAGSAPEDTPTDVAPLKRRLARSQTENLDDFEILLPRAESQKYNQHILRVFSRPIEGAWRAGVSASETRPQVPGAAQQAASTAANQIVAGPDKLAIRYNWAWEVEREEVHLRLNIHKNGPSVSVPPTKIENTVTEHAGSCLDTGIKALTQRLLKRVWTSGERDFIGGRFLRPTAIRYDGQPKATTEEARPCTFFNFPYLALDSHRLKTCEDGPHGCYKAGSDGHPKRTLLQSRYRLESTATREESQSITTLSRQELAKCVRPAHKQENLSASMGALPLVYVPQLWIASLSGDVLLTGGSLSLKELQSKTVRTGPADTTQRSEGSGPALVRILLRHSGKVQRFLYPSDQCDWWFGLLSKQRKISRRLSKSSEVPEPPGPSIPSPSAPVGNMPSVANYRFYTSEDPNDGQSIGILNWLQYLGQSNSKETLDVWLQKDPAIPDFVLTPAGAPPPKPDQTGSSSGAGSSPSSSSATAVPSLATKSAAGSSPPKATAGNTPRTVSPSSTQHQPVSQVLLPFLVWPIIDDLGDEDDRPRLTRAKLKLNEVYNDIVTRHSPKLQNYGEKKYLAASFDPNLLTSEPVHTVDGVLQSIEAEKDSLDDDQMTTIKGFVGHCQSLLEWFTPSDVSLPLSPVVTFGYLTFHLSATERPSEVASHNSVTLYWNLVGFIVNHAISNPDLLNEIPTLSRGFRDIEKRAAELHAGTCTLRDCQPQQQSGDTRLVTARNQVLLEVLLDALKTIFEILVKCAAWLDQQRGQKQYDTKQLSGRHEELVKKACDLLDTAKDRLIAEADDIIHDKGLGPVVTPEAIVIMLLDRLSRGVYEDGTADVMDLYEKIVDTIALQVETKYSRRLLLRIARLQEELDIINKVLLEQKSAILSFRSSLDPQTYQPRSIPRQMNFDHESKYIDKIIRAVQGRIDDCEDLIERAKSLARQNVHLVETRQDENNNAIMVFTIVTVIFLPPSFLTGYFGMNLVGISGTSSRPGHYWELAAPLTFVFVAVCLSIIFYRPAKRRWELGKEKLT